LTADDGELNNYRAMNLVEQIKQEIYTCGGGFQVQETAERLAESVQETSTDFLLWYIEANIVPETDPRSIYDLWREFSIDKQL